MKAVKRPIRVVSEILGGICSFLFLRDPFTDMGWAVTVGSVIVGLICLACYLWSDPDNDVLPDG